MNKLEPAKVSAGAKNVKELFFRDLKKYLRSDHTDKGGECCALAYSLRFEGLQKELQGILILGHR